MSTVKLKARRNDKYRKGRSSHIIDELGNEYVSYNPNFHISLKEGDTAYVLKRMNLFEEAIWIFEIYPIKLESYIPGTYYRFKGYEKGWIYLLTKEKRK